MNVIKNRILGRVMKIFGVNPVYLQNELNKEMRSIQPENNLPEKEKPKIIYQKHRKAKVNNHVAYHYYTAQDRRYFKTPRGKRPIKITATEAIVIITYLQHNHSIEDIYESIDFYHDITIGTLKSWITQYNKGLMNLSISWICDNHIEDIRVDKKCYLKK